MRLRFSIRDLLWLTLVAALIVAWRIDHLSLTYQKPLLVINYPPANGFKTFNLKLPPESPLKGGIPESIERGMKADEVSSPFYNLLQTDR